MSNETTYTTNDVLVMQEYITPELSKAFMAQNIMLNLCHVVDISGQPTRVVSFPVEQSSLTLTTKSYDNTQTTNSTYTPTQVSATAVEYSWMTTVTRMAERSSVIPVADMIIDQAKRTLVQKVDSVAMAVFATLAGGSQNVGATNTDLANVYCLQAIRNQATNAPDMSRCCWILHPMQVHQLRVELAAGSGYSLGTVFAKEGITNMPSGAAVAGCYRGNHLGFPLFESPNVGTISSAADWAGFFGDPHEAIGICVKWLPEIDVQSAAVTGYNGNAILATIAFGVCEKRDLGGCLVRSDAD